MPHLIPRCSEISVDQVKHVVEQQECAVNGEMFFPELVNFNTFRKQQDLVGIYAMTVDRCWMAECFSLHIWKQ